MSMIAVVNIRREPYYRSAAFADGLKKLGYSVMLGGSPGANPKRREDLLVLWNKKAGADEAAADQWEKRGGTVIVAENGYLQKTDKTYYAISVHGHNGSGWFPVNAEKRFDALGFEPKPWVDRPNGYILVCGQRGIGSKMMASPPLWGERTAQKLAKEGHDVRFRAHPGNFAPKTPLSDDLKGAREVHIWSSGSGVKALVEGVPVKHYAPRWICGSDYNNDGGRQVALHVMSHGQWHHEEIATGEPFARILAHLGEATW